MFACFNGNRKFSVSVVLFTFVCVFVVTQLSLDRFSIGEQKYTIFQRLIVSSNSNWWSNSDDDQVFIRSAFLVSDTEIRLTIIKHHKNRKEIYYDYGLFKGEVDITCNLPKCVDGFSPSCTFVSHIGIIKFQMSKNDNKTNDHIILKSPGMQPIKIPITDVRPQGIHRHKLGVCVQPIFMLAEFPILIEFFEQWLEMGATKFYIYRNSYSREIKAILEFYEKASNASIELIDWSDLPSTINGSENSNNLLYRLEVMSAIFDCVQRARHTVSYIAQTDIDETFVLNKNHTNLIQFMDDLLVKNPEMAAASFVSRRAKYPSDLETLTSPYDLDFLAMKDFYVENYYFPRPLYSKLIRIPERSLHAHIHYSLQNEKVVNLNREYKEIKVAKEDAYILHMRRILSSNFKLKGFEKSSLLKNRALKWNEAYKRRLDGYNFLTETWNTDGNEVLKKIEKCRNRHESKRLKQCHSVYDCKVEMDHWFRAEDSWFIL